MLILLIFFEYLYLQYFLYGFEVFELLVYYQEYYIYPQTNKNAIELYDKDDFAKRTVYFSPEVKLMSSFRWSIVRCKDEGIFQLLKSKNEQKDVEEENIYIGGKLQRYLTRIETLKILMLLKYLNIDMCLIL